MGRQGGFIPWGLVIKDPALWKRAVCQYERQEMYKGLSRFIEGSAEHEKRKAALKAYDAETIRLLLECDTE